ncbi:WAS/WASL-interacting protein family member 3 isoform X1 [Drosophila persimilis]|uniref:WAS/WASL-interacting protein family member 3 isoform X1 n=1 Tax=Drosophila persimilis TaxID=7234 RepID=UPI000F0830B8|nr:WAS/WASL-interacting protein family member 3 isoform X1 [Drosophila persimilis]
MNIAPRAALPPAAAVKAASPTLSESGSNSSGSVKRKAGNLNISLGNSFVNSSMAKTTASASTTSLNSSRTSSAGSLRNLAPNKSTLFGGAGSSIGGGGSQQTSPPSTATPTPLPSLAQSHTQTQIQSQQQKPAISFGKPNFAPKPPGLQQLILVNGQQRPAVTRHHSMKSPRSPPASGPMLPPTLQHFGTMRAPLQLQGIDGSVASMRCAPNPPKSRPSVKPPPPPTPARSFSNSNLSNIGAGSSAAPLSAVNTALVQSAATTTQAPSTPITQPPSTSSSSSSVAALRDQFRAVGIGNGMNGMNGGNGNSSPPLPPLPTPASVSSASSSTTASPKSSTVRPIILNGGPIINPPAPPPHRSCPPPPPPQRQSSTAGSGSGSGAGAPVPPQRHSSIRPNAPLTPPTHMANASHQFGSNSGLSAGGGAGCATVGRLVIDLETKFGKRFHNVTEFPKPPPFLNIQKIYPSRTFKASNAAAQTPSNNNNSINNNISAVCNNNASINTNSMAPVGRGTLPPALKPAYAPLKKHRAPAPPPQAGVAAATVSVIRQSSFLYGGGVAGTAGSASSSVRPQSQAAGSVARNSTVC